VEVRSVDGRQGSRFRTGAITDQIVFAPENDGVLTLAGSTATLWSLEGEQAARFGISGGQGTRAAFSPDGRTIATVSENGLLHLWDRRGELLLNLSALVERPYDVQFLDGEYHLFVKERTTGGRRILALTDLEEAMSMATAQAARCLSATERDRYLLKPDRPDWCDDGKWSLPDEEPRPSR